MREQMNTDEVVAHNVHRLRLEKDWSVRDLARTLGAQEHQVRDMERPRRDRPQRSFLWSELVALCGAFETTLFDLVLPPDGVLIKDAELTLHLLDRHASVKDDLDEYHRKPLDRIDFTHALFGISGEDLTPERIAGFGQTLLDERYRRANELAEAFEIAWQRIQEGD